MAKPILSAEAISFGYAAQTIFDDLSLTVGEGEFLGILGPNGSGKSTLIKLLIGMLRPDRGTVKFRGLPLPQIARADLAKNLALVAQGASVSFPFTALEVVMMGRYPHMQESFFECTVDVEAVQTAMVATNTLSLAERLFLELSGGEQQRVMIASALAQTPNALFLDEPTASLDIKYQIQIFQILRRLNQGSGKTVIVALHDLNLAAAFCQKLILLNNGRIVASGTPRHVLVPERLEQVYGVGVELLRFDENGRVAFLPRVS